MPTRKPHQQRKRRRPGAYAEQVKAAWQADAYRWRCPSCPCVANLRGLLRDDCSRCGHVHTPPAATESL
jgi:hypothetical protein